MFFKRLLQKLDQFAHHWWYPIVLAFSATLDVFLGIIPSDALLITATLASPWRWKTFWIYYSVASTLGVWILTTAVAHLGMEAVTFLFPKFEELLRTDASWIFAAGLVKKYGLGVLVIGAFTPLPLLPVVVPCALADPDVPKIVGTYALSRSLKYLTITAVIGKFPRLLDTFKLGKKS